MRNKKMFMPAAMMSVIMLTGSICLSGCSKEAEAAAEDKVEASTEIATDSSTEISTEISTDSLTEAVEETAIVDDEDNGENETATTLETEEAISYTVTDMDKEMLISESTSVYSTPLSFDNKAGEVKKDEAVKVTGYIDATNWYRIKLSDNSEVFITDTYLKEKEAAQPQQQQTQEQPQQQQQETQKPQEQQQQPQIQQPPSDGTAPPINPNTGQPMKSGESYQAPDGMWIYYFAPGDF